MSQIQFVGDSESGAMFSDCRKYRYTLWRRWQTGDNLIAFCGLNPSKADELANDNTISKLIKFSKKWGFDGMVMLNAFDYMATDPKDMKSSSKPCTETNNQAILLVANEIAKKLVLCWGNHAKHQFRSYQLLCMLRNHEKHCFGMTKEGEPKHPLYLKNDSELIRFPYWP